MLSTVFVTWVITGTSKNDVTTKYALLPSTSSKIIGDQIDGSSVLTLATQGENLEGNQQTIATFLNNTDLHMPKLKISVVSELIDNMNDPFPYLEFYIDADATLSDSFATITAEGYSGMTKQTIQTKIKQKGALSMFDYAIFQ